MYTSRVAAFVVACAVGAAVGPAQALTVNLVDENLSPTSLFGPEQTAFFTATGISTLGLGSFDVVFQVAAPVLINVANGQESNSSSRADMSGLTAQLLSSGVAPTVLYNQSNTTSAGTRIVDGFNAEWASLLPDTTYTLRIAYLLSSGSTGSLPDTFSGQLSFFGTTPIPPAVALFGTGLVGLGLLSRRRKKRAATTTL